ncbi:MAG: NAD kinase [Actinomycetes bacterium]
MSEPAGRSVLLLVNRSRAAAEGVAEQLVAGLAAANIEVRVTADDEVGSRLAGVSVIADAGEAARDCELVVVLGGDGTILRGAELARPHGTPLLGVNLGRVGFLAEAEKGDGSSVVTAIISRSYEVEERLAIDIVVQFRGEVIARSWALNEASVEKASRERMLGLVVEIDGRPLSRWGADGVICATPTGSTAYAFSAGGPIVWPEVEALLLVPLSAHALFARPVVVAPTSVLAVELVSESPAGVLFCDGRRLIELPPGARVEVRRSGEPVRLARLHTRPFTDRLVRKFQLPVTGWHGAPESESPQ